MLSREEILSFLKEKKEDFSSSYQVTKLGLFGSFATGEASEESDIDLIIEFAPDTEALTDKKAKIKLSLEEKFHREVDLCREKYIKPYFKSHILKTVIYV